MITRAYQNAKGERQEVTLSADAWEALTEDDLQDLLGFKAPEPEPEAAPAPKPAAPAKRKRR